VAFQRAYWSFPRAVKLVTGYSTIANCAIRIIVRKTRAEYFQIVKPIIKTMRNVLERKAPFITIAIETLLGSRVRFIERKIEM
jgi:hypothetical protein